MIFRRILAALSVCSWLMVAGIATAQEDDNGAILLPEPVAPPVPKVAARKTAKEVYADKSLRSERTVAVLSDETYVNDGSYVEYYRDGTKFCEGIYNMGVPHGKWEYSYPNGQVCKTVTFRRGLPHGQWQVLRDDGTLAAEKSYREGKKQGHWTNYFENGKQVKIEYSYDQGKAVGQRKTYYPNGKTRQVIEFKEGKLHGKMSEWNESGDKVAEVDFVDGKQDGEIVRFENVPGIGTRDFETVAPVDDEELTPLKKTDQGQDFGIE